MVFLHVLCRRSPCENENLVLSVDAGIIAVNPQRYA